MRFKGWLATDGRGNLEFFLSKPRKLNDLLVCSDSKDVLPLGSEFTCRNRNELIKLLGLTPGVAVEVWIKEPQESQ